MKTIKAKVHRLPTEEGCVAFEKDYGFKFIGTTKEGYCKTENQQPQHLYITTNEEINPKIDWVYHTDAAGTKHIIAPNTWEPNLKFARKIIATTDLKLFKNVKNHLTSSEGLMVNLPQIPQPFIEDYCKAGGIDEVLVEYYDFELPGKPIGRKVFKPKLNPDNTIIIHPVEEKMYSVDVMAKVLIDFSNNFLKVRNQVTESEAKKWIEENL